MLEFRVMKADNPRDVDDLFKLYQAAPGYFQTIKGRLPEFNDAVDTMHAAPSDGAGFEKLLGGYWRGTELVGCLDIVFAYPDDSAAYLGLLLFKESMQSKGYGPWVLGELYRIAKARKCSRIRICVIDTNKRALRFWLREGYQQIAIKSAEGYTGSAIILEYKF